MRLPNSEVSQANRYKFDTLRLRETFTLMERISLVRVGVLCLCPYVFSCV